MNFFESILANMGISDVTKRSIEKDGVGPVHFVKAYVENDSLEILLEVESSHDKATHVDLKGNTKTEIGYGYSVIFRFEKINNVLKNEPLSKKNIQNVIDKCDVKVHCDCPAFYWQGMQQDDSANNTSKYKFQGTGGKHIWTMIHANEGGKTGHALCKHLYHGTLWLKNHLLDEVVSHLNLEESKKKHKKMLENIRHMYVKSL